MTYNHPLLLCICWPPCQWEWNAPHHSAWILHCCLCTAVPVSLNTFPARLCHGVFLQFMPSSITGQVLGRKNTTLFLTINCYLVGNSPLSAVCLIYMHEHTVKRTAASQNVSCKAYCRQWRLSNWMWTNWNTTVTRNNQSSLHCYNRFRPTVMLKLDITTFIPKHPDNSSFPAYKLQDALA